MQNLLTDYYGHRVKRYILGQTLTTEAAATGLGSGVSEAHIDTFMQIVKYDATNLEESITTDTVTPLKNWNFPAARNIGVRFVIDTEDPNVEQKLAGMESAWNMGARIKESDVLDAVGVSPPTAEDRVLQNPQLAQQALEQQNPGQARGRSQGAVPANIDTSVGGMTNEVMQHLHGEIPEGQSSMYVAEGDEWREREIPDPELDTGDRHRYVKEWDESKVRRDDKGQFAIKISSAEVESLPGVDLREKIRTWCNEHIRGTTVKNEQSGREIRISKRGIEKTLYHLPDKLPALALMELPSLLKKAVFDRTVSHTKSDDQNIRWHYLKKSLVIDGEVHETTLKIREDRNGNFYYDQHVIKKARPKAAASQKDGDPPDEPGSEDPDSIIDKEEYARKKKNAPGQKDFAWITIGGASEGDKNHVGGTPVQIDKSSGQIVKGPEELTGKKVNELGERKPKPESKPDQDHESAENEHREDAQSSAESKPADHLPANHVDIGDGPGATPTQASLFAEDVEKGESPREAAGKSERKDDPEYAFARQSAIGNAGEDLLGSARHIRNEWKSLEEAEEDGTAADMVTRAMLLKNEPHNLLSLSEENPMTALAMHLVMNRFPNNPLPSSKRVKVDDETARKDRAQYLEAYRLIKDKAESLAETEKDPQKAIEKMSGHVVEMIKKLRGVKGDSYMDRMNATDRYNNTANNLVDLHNALASYKRRQKTHISNRVSELSRALSATGEDPGADDRHQKMVSVVQDLIEGSTTWTKAIGGESSARREYFNPADLYVGIAKREGGEDLSNITKDPNSSVDHVIDHFGVRGVQWGNSVTDEEREHHAARITEAFTDLVDILGIRPEDASLGGKLGLAVGARGRAGAVAHYEPDSAVINLTRKSGVGSLAHEWGHGFDHFLSNFGEKFKSDEESKSWERKDGKWVKKEDSDSVLMAMDAVRKAWDESGFSKRLQSELRSQIDDGLIAPGKRDYWNSNVEKFARTFERYVQHKLESQGRKNTYLAGVETKAHKSGGLWPEDHEVEAMTPAFDDLFAAYRESKGITQKYSREEIMRYFREQMNMTFAEAMSL